jgi:hypothetical protein
VVVRTALIPAAGYGETRNAAPSPTALRAVSGVVTVPTPIVVPGEVRHSRFSTDGQSGVVAVSSMTGVPSVSSRSHSSVASAALGRRTTGTTRAARMLSRTSTSLQRRIPNIRRYCHDAHEETGISTTTITGTRLLAAGKASGGGEHLESG